MKSFVVISALTVFLLLSGCGVQPVPGTPADKWATINEKIGYHGSGVISDVRNSKKILIGEFKVKYVYSVVKGEMKGDVVTTNTLRWSDDVYKTVTNGMYDTLVDYLKATGHDVVDVKEVVSDPLYTDFVGDKPVLHDSKENFFKAADVRTDTVTDWVWCAPYGMRTDWRLLGVSAIDKLAHKIGADTKLFVEVTVGFDYKNGNAVINGVTIREWSDLYYNQRKVWGSIQEDCYFKSAGDIYTKDKFVGGKYANYPTVWESMTKGTQISADAAKYVESMIGSFSVISDLQTTLIANKIPAK